MTTLYAFTPTRPAPNAVNPSVITGLNPGGINTAATPSPVLPFSFQPTLDGQQYIITAPWSLFGQRFYLNCYTLNGTLIFSLPLIGSGPGTPINAISWDEITGLVTVECSAPHGLRIGTIVALTVNGMVPTAYDGVFNANVINQTQVTYPLTSDPGSPVSFGEVRYNVNLAGGYFKTSTLYYHTDSSHFEVTP